MNAEQSNVLGHCDILRGPLWLNVTLCSPLSYCLVMKSFVILFIVLSCSVCHLQSFWTLCHLVSYLVVLCCLMCSCVVLGGPVSSWLIFSMPVVFNILLICVLWSCARHLMLCVVS